MSELADELANILSAVVTQIRGLSDDEVKALAAGDAEFRLIPKKAVKRPAPRKVAESTVDVDADRIRAELKAFPTEAAALAHLQALTLNLAAAKALAGELGLRLPARPTVTTICAEIVRVYVGGRLNAATVQGL